MVQNNNIENSIEIRQILEKRVLYNRHTSHFDIIVYPDPESQEYRVKRYEISLPQGVNMIKDSGFAAFQLYFPKSFLKIIAYLEKKNVVNSKDRKWLYFG